MKAQTSPAAVRRAWATRQEILLIDLREEHWFAQGHPLFAASLPLARLELDVLDRAPRKDTPIVLYDDGEGFTSIAAQRLNALGYRDVRLLAGGLQGWRDAGFELFADVNSPSKAFGELVEHRRGTPHFTAEELDALIRARADLVILDARRFEEYATMSIPGGVSMPGGELVLRARALAPDPQTIIVVNCAGRTRSIIGAQSLINAGVKNPVRALRNGTIGWTLAGLSLDHGAQRRAPGASQDGEAEAAKAARAVRYRAGVRGLSWEDLQSLADDQSRTLYRYDVRTPEEYAEGHAAGFRSAPGGQLVQETDVFAPVRGARIVLSDDKSIRADMTASWLAQMGWEVYVLEGAWGAIAYGAERPTLPEPPRAALIEPSALRAAPTLLLDLATTAEHRRGHIPGARFASRTGLAAALGAYAPDTPLTLTSPDGLVARFAARELEAAGFTHVRALAGGTEAWRAGGGALAGGIEDPLSPPIDVYRRPYEGVDNPAAAMQAYLDWEYGLVAQLERDASHGFFVL